jgi:hypothetical protein
MATSNENAGLHSQSARQPNVAKPYRRPTLVKGPLLSVITALIATPVSGAAPVGV